MGGCVLTAGDCWPDIFRQAVARVRDDGHGRAMMRIDAELCRKCTVLAMSSVVDRGECQAIT